MQLFKEIKEEDEKSEVDGDVEEQPLPVLASDDELSDRELQAMQGNILDAIRSFQR